MVKRVEHLINTYYNIDNDIKKNLEYYLKQTKKKQDETIEYADNILFTMRCELMMGKYTYIKNNIDRLLNLYIKLKDPFGEFFALTTYGLSCRDCMNIPEAKKVLSKAYEISHQVSDYNLIICGLINFLSLDYSKKVVKSNIEQLEEAMVYINKVSSKKILASYYINYAYMLFVNEDLEKAREYNLKALKLYEDFYTNKNAPNILAVKSNIAEIHIALKEHDKAIELYKKVYETAKKNNDSVIAYDSLRGLVKAYEELKDYENAFAYLKLVNERLSLLSQNYNHEDSFSNLNEYLSTELKESKEKLFLYNAELKQKNIELKEHIEQINLISKIGKKLTTIINENELFEGVVDILYDNPTVDSAGLILVDEKKRTVHLKYLLENDQKILKASVLSYDNKHSIAAYCARENKDVFIKNLSKEINNYIEDHVLDIDLKKIEEISGSLIYCRLLSDDEIIGILTIQNKQNDVFDESIFETMKSISSYVAIALSNSNKSTLLEKLSFYDELTGLKNRRSFIEDTAKIKNKTDSYNSFSLIIADMNHLKAINDDKGHLEGDRYLIEIAKVLLENNTNYQIYRLGGDEFAIIMTDIDENEVIKYIYDVKKACQNKEFEPYPLSLAMGYQYTEDNINITNLFKQAENAMYQDKEEYYKSSKRNRRKPV